MRRCASRADRRLPLFAGRQLRAPQADNSIEEGLFSPIIERNTAYRRAGYHLSTMQDNQPSVSSISSGRGAIGLRERQIGDLKIPMRPGPAGSGSMCAFSYDINA